jgi:hypothetical protein
MHDPANPNPNPATPPTEPTPPSPRSGFFMSGFVDENTPPIDLEGNPIEPVDPHANETPEERAEREANERFIERHAGRSIGSIFATEKELEEMAKADQPPEEEEDDDDPPADPNAPAPADPKPADPKPTDPKPSDKPKLKVTKAAPLPTKTPAPDPAPASPPTTPKAPATPPPADPPANDPEPFTISEEDTRLLEQLPEADRDAAMASLDLWQSAAKVDPEKYGKRFAEWRKFLQDDVARRNKVLEADPEADPEEDPAYVAWRKRTMPKKPSAVEARNLEREIIRHEAREEARREAEAKTADLRAKVQRKEIEEQVRPQLQNALQDFVGEYNEALAALPENKELMETFQQAGGGQGGVDAVRAEYGDEVADGMIQHFQSGYEIVATIIGCRGGLTAFDQQNPVHQAAADRINKWEAAIAADPTKAQRGGKQFAPWGEYLKLSPEEQKTRWTLSNRDLTRMQRAESASRFTRFHKGIQERNEKILAQWQKKNGQGGAAPAPKPNAPAAPSSVTPDEDDPPVPGTIFSRSPSSSPGPSAKPKKASGFFLTGGSTTIRD